MLNFSVLLQFVFHFAFFSVRVINVKHNQLSKGVHKKLVLFHFKTNCFFTFVIFPLFIVNLMSCWLGMVLTDFISYLVRHKLAFWFVSLFQLIATEILTVTLLLWSLILFAFSSFVTKFHWLELSSVVKRDKNHFSWNLYLTLIFFCLDSDIASL